MIKALSTAAIVLALTTTLAAAQSSQPQGGTDQTQMNNTGSSMGNMTSEKMGKAANAHNAMKKKMKKKKSMKMDKGDTMAPADSMKK